jgi:hypothetical protein
MSSEVSLYKIPRYGDARVAFLGVEVNDTYLLMVCFIGGLILGTKYGIAAFIVISAGGYFLTQLWLDWKSGQLPGGFRAYLYSQGWLGYTSGLKSGEVIYHGDALIMNAAYADQELEMLELYIENKSWI